MSNNLINNKNIKVRWIGNAFFSIQYNNKLFYIDPWISGNNGVEIEVGEAIRQNPRYIFVTHGHPGHYGRGDSTYIANKAQSLYIAPIELIKYLKSNYLLETTSIGMQINGSILLDDIEVSMYAVKHPPTPPLNTEWEAFPGEPNGLFIFQIDDKVILHVGDTESDEVYNEIAKKHYKIDLAILPLWSKGMGGTLKSAVRNTIEIIKTIKPDYVMLHNRWNPSKRSFKAFLDMIKNENIMSRVVDQKIGIELSI